MCDEEKSESESKSKGPHLANIALRIVAMALSVAAAALMATASQCATAPSSSTESQYGAPPHIVTYRDFGPFVYLVAANAVAAGAEAVAVFLVIWKKGPHADCRLLVPVLDATVPALLYSSAGAAFAAGDVNYCTAYGRRVSVCAGSGGAGNFCSQAHLSMYIALAAAVAVSAAAVAMHCGSGKSKPKPESDSEDETCGHGCHSKH